MAKNSARDFADWLQGEKKAAQTRAVEERRQRLAAGKQSRNVTASVPASGPCSKCGQTNHGTVSASGVQGASVVVTATATCGIAGCGGVVHLTGQGVLG